MLRPIIQIDEGKCDGCGKCILDCAEGALAIVDGKAKLISEVYCDGLGACLNCPKGALTLAMREAPAFDEEAALAAKSKRDNESCKGAQAQTLWQLQPINPISNGQTQGQLQSWPIQLELVPSNAAYLKDADLLLAAHCAGFALPNINSEWMKGRVLLIACSKLQNNERLLERLKNIVCNNDIKSLTVLRMSVHCCGGLERIAVKALEECGSKAAFKTEMVKIG